MHVQEVWGESTLRSIRVRRLPLALLLSIDFGFCYRGGSIGRSTSQETGFGENAGEVAVNGVQTVFARREDGVGMLNVGTGEVLDRGLEGRKSNDDLIVCVSKSFWIIFCIEHDSSKSSKIRTKSIKSSNGGAVTV